MPVTTSPKIVWVQHVDSGRIMSTRPEIAAKKTRPMEIKKGKDIIYRYPSHRNLDEKELAELGGKVHLDILQPTGIQGKINALKVHALGEKATRFDSISRNILGKYLKSPAQFLRDLPDLLELETITEEEKITLTEWGEYVQNGLNNVLPARKAIPEFQAQLQTIADKWIEDYKNNIETRKAEEIKRKRLIELDAEVAYAEAKEKKLPKPKKPDKKKGITANAT